MNSTRRSFLKGFSASMVGASSFGALSTALLGMNAHAANVSGYKALVCVFFFGGKDSHDMLLPYDLASYTQFSNIRAPLLANYANSRARNALLPLAPDNASNFGGREFALPPEMPGLQNLFNTGEAAIIGNVGPLAQPITRTEYYQESVPVPARLFSHNDQQATWQASAPEGAQFGWGGLFGDAVANSNANLKPEFTTISSNGTDLFLTGNVTSPYNVSLEGGAPSIDLVDNIAGYQGTPEGDALYQSIESLARGAAYNGSNLITRDIAAELAQSFDSNTLYNEAIANAPDLTTIFPTTGLGLQLKAVANTISIRSNLQAGRQVFFVGIGGFDTHDNQPTAMPALQAEIDAAIVAFHAEIGVMGLNSDVTLFTASEFGRTLAINGDGTDHGWGSHHFAIGGAVNGKQIYGAVPPPFFGNDWDGGSGRMIPAVSVDEFAAPLGRWFGLTEPEIAASLPNLANFSSRPALTFI